MEMSRGNRADEEASALITEALDRYRVGDGEAARRTVRQALAIVGAYPVAWRVFAYTMIGTDSALRAFNRVLAIDPTDADTWCDVAAMLADKGRPLSRRALRRALALRPASASSWRDVGTLDPSAESAATGLRRSAALDPHDAGTWRALAHRLPAGADATSCGRRSVALSPEAANGLVEHGLAIQAHDGWASAYSAFRRATAADPLLASAWHNRAAAAMAAGDPDDGDAALALAIRIEPALAPALLLSGNRAIERAELAAARRRYRRAMAVDGGFAEATLNLAMLDLLDGDYRRGWLGFAARWLCRSHERFKATSGAATWDGDAAPGKRLLLRAEPEQALGDTLQFARFVPLAATRVEEVVLECDPSLRRLLGRVSGVSRTIPLGGDAAGMDLSCGLMDLGSLFAPTLEALPRSGAYLAADAAPWRDRLSAVPRPWIGICWRGNPRFRMDRLRSPGIGPLAPIFRRGAGHLISLVLERSSVEAATGLVDPMPMIEDMADTAGLVSALDLVITSDTSIAHLSGGLGRPTWAMLHEPADWRWLRHRDDSPWYPTVRLFRQPRPGDWAAVAAEVEANLDRLLSP